MQRALLSFLVLTAAAQTPPPPGARERVTVSTGWRFQMDISGIGEKEKWFAPGFDHCGWSRVPVPKAWDLYDEALWGYEGIGWYVTAIDGALARPGRVQRLLFGRVLYHAKVWLNGEYLGENIGGYLPFEFDVSGKLRRGQPNLLALRVDNQPRLTWLPAAKQIEWVQYGGILAPVALETSARTYLSDLAINAVPEGAGAALECAVEVASRQEQPADLTLRLQVESPQGAAGTTRLTLAPGAVESRTLSLRMSRAARWSPKSPSLYTLRATLESGGKIVDRVSSRFGVRKVEARGRDILLNGERLWIQGVNRYDEYGKYGVNAPRHLVVEDLRRMKSAGINFIRVHYPQSPDLLSLYDEMGFMLMEEVPINWWGNRFSGTGEEVIREDILTQAVPMLERMIRRDRNHPCLVFWSMCNESQTQTEPGIKVMRTLLKRARELDPTRLATFVIATREASLHKAFEDADFVSVNIYVGSHEGKPARRISDAEPIIGQAAEAYLRRQLAAFPSKPLLVTEFGTPGVHGVHGDVEYTEEYQAAQLQAVWGAIRRCKEASGGVMWSWADYYHRRNFIVYAAFGPYGVVTVDRKPKAALQALIQMYGGAAAR